MMNYLVDLQEKPREIEIGPNGMSIDLLRAVYRNPSIPLPVRIRCAVAALPHEVPRLQVTAQVNEQSFAETIGGEDKEIRSNEMDRRRRRLSIIHRSRLPSPCQG